jgi:hypothetical protein
VQRQDAVLHRKGFVCAQTEFVAGIGDALRIVGQRKNVAAGNGRFGASGQIEGCELAGGIRRETPAPRSAQATDAGR